MAGPLVAITQNIFFPKCKITPKKSWHEGLAKLGKLEKIAVKRNKGKLIALKIKTPHPNAAKKIAILAHPISKKAKFYFEENRINPYLKKGYDVVVFDFNGFGESDRIDLYYWKDSKTVIEYFSKEASHVILHGTSFGSFHIIPSIRFLPENSTVVLENTNRSLYDYWKRWFLTRNAVRFLQKLNIQAVKDMNIISAFQTLGRQDINFLLIACENDLFTPEEEMADLSSYIQAPKKFVTFENAEHLHAPLVNETLYTKIIEEMAR